jgi:hypothetical protein
VSKNPDVTEFVHNEKKVFVMENVRFDENAMIQRGGMPIIVRMNNFTSHHIHKAKLRPIKSQAVWNTSDDRGSPYLDWKLMCVLEKMMEETAHFELLTVGRSGFERILMFMIITLFGSLARRIVVICQFPKQGRA